MSIAASISDISIPSGAIKRLPETIKASLTGKFQFLLVRLRGVRSCHISEKGMGISIPSGAIKRTLRDKCSASIEEISIPSGAIKRL